MKTRHLFLAVAFFFLTSCSGPQNKEIVERNFYNNTWNRFDYINSEFEVKNISDVYQLVMDVKLTDEYPDEYVQFNLSVFYPNDGGYRSNNFRYRVKDVNGKWNTEQVDGFYNFEFTINSKLEFGDKGVYKFMIENKYPKFDLYGINQLHLYVR